MQLDINDQYVKLITGNNKIDILVNNGTSTKSTQPLLERQRKT